MAGNPDAIYDVKRKRVPFNGNMYSRLNRGIPTGNGAFATASGNFIVNGMIQTSKNLVTGDDNLIIRKRPGIGNASTFTGASSDTIRAATVWSGETGAGTNEISIFGDSTSGTDYRVFKAGTSAGTISSTSFGIQNCNGITECTSASVPAIIFPVNTSSTVVQGWFLAFGGALTQIVDADFTVNGIVGTFVGKFAFMNGYAYYMTRDGKIWNSDINDLTSWNAAGFISSQGSPDGGRGVVRYKNTIVSFNDLTIEFFEDVGATAPASPLKVIPNLQINLGVILSKDTYIEAYNTIFFMGRSRAGGPSIYMLDGYSPVKISNTDVDKIIKDTSSSFQGAFYVQGDPCILLRIAGTGHSLIYNLTTKLWSFWEFTSSFSVLFVAKITNEVAVTSVFKTAGVATIDDTEVYTEEGSNYSFIVQTEKWDGGTSARKRLNRMWLIGDKQSSTTTVSIQYSDDDYNTWSTAVTIDMGSSELQHYVNNLGIFQRRAFRITYTGANPLALEGMEFEYSEMNH